MSYPQLVIDRVAISENAAGIVSRCNKAGIAVAGVTKGVSAQPDLARIMKEAGCVWLADSRLANIRRLREAAVEGPFLLLRIPMPQEIPELFDLADMTLVSMAETIDLLDRHGRDSSREIGTIVMIDLGDLREGFWPDEIEAVAEAYRRAPRVRCCGIGVNFGCFGGVLPTASNLSRLVVIARELERYLGTKMQIFSGGATSSLALLEKGELPEEINQLRIGEAILLGSDVTGNRLIPWLRQDTMTFEAQIVEVRCKPSVPIGIIGADAFGNVPVFEDRGKRLRAIVASGRQDIRPEGLVPQLPGAEILGASSDHLLLDVEDCHPSLKLGDIISFRVDYGAMMAATTSRYVEVKVF